LRALNTCSGSQKLHIVRLGLTNARVIQANALTSGLDKNSFDFAHERLVMINRPNPEAILFEMVALVREGGIVAVEEVDDASWLCYPSHPSWDILVEIYHSAFSRYGGNVFLGRCRPKMPRSAGLEYVQCKVHVDIVQSHGTRRKPMTAAGRVMMVGESSGNTAAPVPSTLPQTVGLSTTRSTEPSRPT
jgi:hypothetical protein